MQSCEKKVEGEANVCEVGEIGEPVSCVRGAAMGAIPSKDEEDGDKAVERDDEAKK